MLAEGLSVVTWNVWFSGFEIGPRATRLLQELDLCQPSVVCLHEVAPDFVRRLAVARWLEGWSASATDAETLGDYGVVVLSRFPIVEIGWHNLPSGMGRRLLVVRLDSRLAVANVHLESLRDNAEIRAAQLEGVFTALRDEPEVVLTGDFNFRPTDPENALIPHDFVDAWAVLRPDDPGYTIDTDVNEMRFAYKSKKKQVRFDRILVRSRSLRPKTVRLIGTAAIPNAFEENIWPSDHFGVHADLR
jgi:tyrosyl-DNA phosphodiesterase 2